MIDATHPYLVASWTDADLAPLKEWRKAKAREGQDPEAGRDTQREAKKYEKAATLILNAIEGTGPCYNGVTRGFFPAELQMHLLTATAYIGRSA